MLGIQPQTDPGRRASGCKQVTHKLRIYRLALRLMGKRAGRLQRPLCDRQRGVKQIQPNNVSLQLYHRQILKKRSMCGTNLLLPRQTDTFRSLLRRQRVGKFSRHLPSAPTGRACASTSGVSRRAEPPAKPVRGSGALPSHSGDGKPLRSSCLSLESRDSIRAAQSGYPPVHPPYLFTHFLL